MKRTERTARHRFILFMIAMAVLAAIGVVLYLVIGAPGEVSPVAG